MTFAELDPNRTIVAVASTMGPSPRGIVRFSGSQSIDLVQAICDQPLETRAGPSWHAVSLRLADFETPVSATVLIWPDQRSYTRQPAAELHLVASAPLLESVVRAACRQGASLAAPGEFTMRAFLAGRIDLSQAESIIASVDATSQAEFQWALAQTAGGMRDPLQKLRGELLNLLAHLEAGLDFVEDDITFIAFQELESGLQHGLDTITRMLDQIRARSVHAATFRVAITGRPNAGKSSLFNALLGRSAALATEYAGTTRDYLSENLLLDGIEIQLIDTAGRTDKSCDAEPLDSLIQDRAEQVLADANLWMMCVESGTEPNEQEQELIQASGDRIVFVRTKSDLVTETASDLLAVSAVSGQGLRELKATLRRIAVARHEQSLVGLSAERCRESLQGAHEALCRSMNALSDRAGDEWVAAELRLALDELGRITGTVYNDELLDRIFSRFCIGK